jgi:hypothetical protein
MVSECPRCFSKDLSLRGTSSPRGNSGMSLGIGTGTPWEDKSIENVVQEEMETKKGIDATYWVVISQKSS